MAAVVDRQTFVLPRAVAPDTEVFAIGDIHGRPDLLHALLDEAALEPRRREKRVLLFLGDLVDRGPDSLGTVDLAVGAGALIGADAWIGLMGNHETMMRLALDPRTPWDDAIEALEGWLRNGGGAVVRQFARFEVEPAGPEELLTVIRVALPDRIRIWLESLRTNWRSGQTLFVHAGVNPAVDLERFSRPAVEHAARGDRRGHALGLGALAFPGGVSGSRRLQRLFRRARAHAERRPAQPFARGSDSRLPPQPRRRLRDGPDWRRWASSAARRSRC